MVVKPDLEEEIVSEFICSLGSRLPAFYQRALRTLVNFEIIKYHIINFEKIIESQLNIFYWSRSNRIE